MLTDNDSQNGTVSTDHNLAYITGGSTFSLQYQLMKYGSFLTSEVWDHRPEHPHSTTDNMTGPTTRLHFQN